MKNKQVWQSKKQKVEELGEGRMGDGKPEFESVVLESSLNQPSHYILGYLLNVLLQLSGSNRSDSPKHGVKMNRIGKSWLSLLERAIG